MKSKMMLKKRKRVFVAMSGGVDSSVTALLLKNEGYDVVGVFMRCFNIDGCQDRDAEDARRVAEKLGIPFYVWDFEDEYKKKVVKYMVDGYRSGITPNPDVMCNKEIKFGLFFDRAIALGADYISTGHYVRLVTDANNAKKTRIMRKGLDSRHSHGFALNSHRLFQAEDSNKDQSYFLWTLTQKQLARCLFPIGDYLKPEVRAIARKARLPTADKKDSQGICFLGKVSISDFLKQYIRPKRGEILTIAGEKIGRHEGVYFYTIGQRHLGVSNLKSKISKGKGDQKPFYVSEKNIETNTLTVAEGEKNKALYKKEIELIDVNFLNPAICDKLPVIVYARVRYRQPLGKARLVARGKRQGKKMGGRNFLSPVAGHWSLIFAKPQKFVASGQSAVFYLKSGEMLGGGIIL